MKSYLGSMVPGIEADKGESASSGNGQIDVFMANCVFGRST